MPRKSLDRRCGTYRPFLALVLESCQIPTPQNVFCDGLCPVSHKRRGQGLQLENGGEEKHVKIRRSSMKLGGDTDKM